MSRVETLGDLALELGKLGAELRLKASATEYHAVVRAGDVMGGCIGAPNADIAINEALADYRTRVARQLAEAQP